MEVRVFSADFLQAGLPAIQQVENLRYTGPYFCEWLPLND